MKHHASIAALLVITLTGIQWHNAQAADAQGVFNVLGPGTDTCKDFVDAAHPDDGGDAPWTRYNLYTAYATGYLTGYNEFVDGTVDIRGQRKMLEIMGMIETFCDEHPSADLHAGLVQVVEQLEPYRKRGPDEPFSGDTLTEEAFAEEAFSEDSLPAEDTAGDASPDRAGLDASPPDDAPSDEPL
jgi:hypothetical protein